MSKRKNSKKSYDTSLKKVKITNKDRLLGNIKVGLLLGTVIFVAILTISKINS